MQVNLTATPHRKLGAATYSEAHTRQQMSVAAAMLVQRRLRDSKLLIEEAEVDSDQKFCRDADGDIRYVLA